MASSKIAEPKSPSSLFGCQMPVLRRGPVLQGYFTNLGMSIVAARMFSLVGAMAPVTDEDFGAPEIQIMPDGRRRNDVPEGR